MKNEKFVRSESNVFEQYLRVRWSTIFHHNNFVGSESIDLLYSCVVTVIYFNNLWNKN